MHQASHWPLKGAKSAQKALQDSETTELVGGTKEKSVSGQGVIELSSRQFLIFLHSWPTQYLIAWELPDMDVAMLLDKAVENMKWQ